jgi:outer membrane autotransporter protein
VLRAERANRDRAGAYAAFGRADGSVDHDQGPRTIDGGNTKFDAVSLGSYWTRTGAEGWYLDGVLQATWYDVTMSSDRGVGDGDTQGWGFTASAEGGYPFALNERGWSAEPQAQLNYQTFSFDDFDDIAAEVSYSDTDSLAGRIGARLTRSWDAAGGGEPSQPAVVWARVNLWQEFLANPTTTFSAFGQSVPFTGSLDDSWAEIEIGADMKARAEAWSFYGDLSYQATFDGDATAFGAEAGVKWRWRADRDPA